MNIWLPLIIAGIINYLTRLISVLFINPKKFNRSTKNLLTYVPSAVFPAIIFPAVFFNDYGNFVNFTDPKIFGSIIAILVGFFSKNIIITIISGISAYWISTFFLLNY